MCIRDRNCFYCFPALTMHASIYYAKIPAFLQSNCISHLKVKTVLAENKRPFRCRAEIAKLGLGNHNILLSCMTKRIQMKCVFWQAPTQSLLRPMPAPPMAWHVAAPHSPPPAPSSPALLDALSIKPFVSPLPSGLQISAQ